MVMIKGIKIENKKEYPYDIDSLVSEETLKLKGEKTFQAKGFIDDARNNVFGSIARRAGKLEANLAIVEDEYSTKRGLYKARVHFYYDKIEEKYFFKRDNHPSNFLQ